MNINWQKLVINLVVWAVAEATLNVVGLDTIADYSEFFLAKSEMEMITNL